MSDHPPELPDLDPASGTVVEQDRGSLPFCLIHGESLVACAAWALGDAGVVPVDLTTPWSVVVESGETFVLHDALCPLVPAWFIAECVARAQADDVVVVGVRPVTDTVKTLSGDLVGETVDRESLAQVTSPLVLPASVVAGLDAFPGTDLAAAVDRLRADHEVVLVTGPPEGRRVSGPDDVRLLEALTARPPL